MRDRHKADRLRVRPVWLSLGCAAIAVALLVGGLITVLREVHRDPCESVLPYAAGMGLRLSDAETVVACEEYPSYPDSSAKVLVRTASRAARDALLRRSGVSEDVERTMISLNDGPIETEVRRPNLNRSEQIYLATTKSGDQLSISYDESVQAGLLLTVWAIET
ncbi:hypothetical protein HH308_16395 [Gordonia sp. TBRC 11910]|uniref:Uncharacterized protein n=1 Tax=Gordonia asplenii TaxID=2725283 RepID=A0A848L2G4_9ACTN|nr:hypothetical protein [Gordonia asplenii]NMO02793.1 hypothetical protein [Gordonia asplenii]